MNTRTYRLPEFGPEAHLHPGRLLAETERRSRRASHGAGSRTDLAPTSSNPYVLDDPRHNLVLLAQELLLLEGHLADPERRCPSCVTKHALTARGLADEGRRLDGGGALGPVWSAVAALAWDKPAPTAVRQIRRDAIEALIGQRQQTRHTPPAGVGGGVPAPRGWWSESEFCKWWCKGGNCADESNSKTCFACNCCVAEIADCEAEGGEACTWALANQCYPVSKLTGRSCNKKMGDSYQNQEAQELGVCNDELCAMNIFVSTEIARDHYKALFPGLTQEEYLAWTPLNDVNCGVYGPGSNVSPNDCFLECSWPPPPKPSGGSGGGDDQSKNGGSGYGVDCYYFGPNDSTPHAFPNANNDWCGCTNLIDKKDTPAEDAKVTKVKYGCKFYTERCDGK